MKRSIAGVTVPLYAAAGVLAILLLRFVQSAPPSHDEVEHVHVAWRLLQGDRPYADFPQNHTPLVWFVGAAALPMLPETAGSVLGLRWVAFASFLLAGAIGWKMLTRLRPDLHPCAYPLALIGALSLVYRMEWYRFRPDVFMSLLVTLGLFVMTGRSLTPARAGITGVLFGAAACFTPKMWPLLFLLPARLVYDAWVARRVREPLVRLLAYGAGGAVAAAPLIVWLAVEGLLPGFLNGVVAFNGSYPKPPDGAFSFLRRPLVLVSLAGAALMVWHGWRRRADGRWPYVALGTSVVLGLSIVFFSIHNALYNQQAVAIPAAIAFAYAGASVVGRSPSALRILLAALFLFVAVRREVAAIVQIADDDWQIGFQEVDTLAGLSRAAGGSCVAFAPCHPIYCEDEGPLMLMWDVLFVQHPDREFRERHERYWKETAEAIIDGRPGLVVDRCERIDLWDAVGGMGPLDAATLGRMRQTLSASYERHVLDRSIVWVRR